MSQLESAEQVNVSNNAGSFEQVSQQIWSSIQSDAESNMGNQFSNPSSGLENSTDSILPSITLSGDESEMMGSQESGVVEGDRKDDADKQDGADSSLSSEQKPPVEPVDKPDRQIPDKPGSMDKPKLPELKPADKPLAPALKPSTTLT